MFLDAPYIQAEEKYIVRVVTAPVHFNLLMRLGETWSKGVEGGEASVRIVLLLLLLLGVCIVCAVERLDVYTYIWYIAIYARVPLVAFASASTALFGASLIVVIPYLENSREVI